ncbi:cytochrome P450 [Aspergillus candidus]|uniref:Cytochrome P450 n=1 Tax=Aspergillus candidus TaxID=41067 RepID=A0A2I2FMP2_ASPCN|nr:cytochrome P450 [Aspergillus candidus]PLB41896.1 cytochrome P450 [Aspergillus candidus]
MIVSNITLTAVIGLCVLLLYKCVVYPAFLSPLSKIPNAHWSAPVSPAWMLWKRFRSQNNRTIHKAHAKLGPIVRLSPSEISINCVDGGIKTVYSGGFEKHEWYPRVFGSLGTVSMFTMIGSKTHSTRKRMMSSIYSKSHLQSSPHMRLISEEILYSRLLPLIQAAASGNHPVEVHDLNQGTTMDFMSSYLFGLANGTNFLQDPTSRQKLLEFYQSRKPYEFYHQEIPDLLSWLKSVGIRLIPKWCDAANEVLDAWGLDLCDKAEQSLESSDPKVEPAVYKQLAQALLKQGPVQGENLKQRRLDIACEMYDQLTAGFETSAVALTYLFWELSRNPEVQDKLREEVLTLNPTLTYPRPQGSTGLPAPKSIDALPLLDAIVAETLRLHAPIPGIQPRVTPYPSCSLAGYNDIPPNTRVNAQAWSLHRNPKVFPSPETWQPRRWLKDANPSSDLDEMRRWFWAFGSGGRMCVGSNLALQEIKLVVAAIYTNFKTAVIADDDMEEIDAYTVKPRGDKLILKFEPV